MTTRTLEEIEERAIDEEERANVREAHALGRALGRREGAEEMRERASRYTYDHGLPYAGLALLFFPHGGWDEWNEAACALLSGKVAP